MSKPIIHGTAGDDSLTGTSGNDFFSLGQGGSDSASGVGGNDTFSMQAALDAGDQLDGGAGNDVVVLNGDYSGGLTFEAATLTSIETLRLEAGSSYDLTSVDTTVAAGTAMTVDGSRLGAGDTLSFDGSAESDGVYHLIGGAGDDVLKGGGDGSTFDLSHGGEDTATGGSGNDAFALGATLDAGDKISGGFGGRDVLRLDGDYSAGQTLGPDTLFNIAVVQFAKGHSYNLTIDNENFLSGPTALINAGALGAGNGLTFNASASDANFHFIGGAGDDVLSGGTAGAIFDLSHGGNDTATGGVRDDSFDMGATFTAADAIDGGTGNDKVTMDGMGAADSLTFSATTMVNVETLTLQAGHDYDLIANDATVAAGATLLVAGNTLGASDTLTFDGSAETDGHFVLRGGAGNDALTGGAQSDTFILLTGGNDTAHGGGGDDTFTMGAALTAADSIDGGAGNDTVTLDGDYSAALVFGAATMTSVETLDLIGGHDYNLQPNSSNVAHNATLTVDASTLGAGDSLTFDASQLAFLTLDVTAGAGNDVITGPNSATYTLDLSLGGDDIVHTASGGLDTFLMGAALTANDQIDGGGGGSIDLDGDYTGANAVIFGATTITNMQNLTVEGGHSYDLTANAATLGTHQLRVFATGLLAGDTLSFDGSATITGVYQFNAGAGSYFLTGGGNNDQFNMGASFTASDHVDGGSAGADALDLNGDYSAGLVFGAATMVNITELQLSGGHSYDLTTNDATVASGAGLTVDATALGAGDTMTFDASAETDGLFAINGGAGNDTVTLSSAAVLAGSTFAGGAGTDTLVLNGDFSAGVTFGASTISNVENLTLAAGHSYNLTTDDANVASGQTLTVDGSGASGNETVNGFAETDGNYDFIFGTGASNLFTGGAGDDTFDMSRGGSTKNEGDGNDGDDTFNIGANWRNGHTVVDGGTGDDTINFNGDNGPFIQVNSDEAVNVEKFTFAAGTSYQAIFENGSGGGFTGSTFIVDASALGAADSIGISFLQLNRSDIQFTGGAGNDFVVVDNTAFSANSQFDGGTGNDKLQLDGDFSSSVTTFTATTVTNFETLQFLGGFSYKIATDDATVASGQTLTVDAGGLGASDFLQFDGSAETDGKFAITGGAGDDTVTIASASVLGNSTFNGSAGNDTLVLNGDFSGGVSFTSNTVQNIDTITLDAGHSYSLSLSGSTVASGGTITIDGSALGATDAFNFGFDTFGGGDSTYILKGGAGSDEFSMLDTLTAADQIDGGGGANYLFLNGDYSAGITFNANTIQNISAIFLVQNGSDSYNLTTNDGNVAAGQTLGISAGNLLSTASLTFNGAAETDGSFDINSSAGANTLTGGALADSFDVSHEGATAVSSITGGGGADLMTAGAGADEFIYSAASESNDTNPDVISGFDADADSFAFGHAITTVNATSGTVNDLSGSLGLVINDQLHAHGAVVVTATGGTFAGDVFLVVDGDGNSTYDAGSDYVINITGATHLSDFGTGNFI